MASALAVSLSVTAAQGGPKEDYEKGWELYDKKGDVFSAMKFLKKSADAGYGPAQALLGYIYDYSELDKESVEMYRKAAEQGTPAGEYGLGDMYAKGEGIEKDLGKALELITKAAEKDYLPAVSMLVDVYKLGGLGVEPDPEKSMYWNKKKEALEEKKRKEEEERKKKEEKAEADKDSGEKAGK